MVRSRGVGDRIDHDQHPAQIEIYNLAGPNVEADAALEATVNFLASPYFTLQPSIKLKAGLDFDNLDGLTHGSLEVTLGTFNFPAFTINSARHSHPQAESVQPVGLPWRPHGAQLDAQRRQDPDGAHLAAPRGGYR